MIKNYIRKTKILAWAAIAFICIVVSSCSPYNGNPQHDTAVVANKLQKGELRSKQCVRELVEYGYDEETAQEIVDNAFSILTRGL